VKIGRQFTKSQDLSLESVQWWNLLVGLACNLDGGQVNVPEGAKNGFRFWGGYFSLGVAGVGPSQFLPSLVQVLLDNVFQQGRRPQSNAQKTD